MNGYTIKLGYEPLPAMGAHGAACAIVVLDAPAIDFLLSYLPAGDGFTQELEQLRERAKDFLWGRQ